MFSRKTSNGTMIELITSDKNIKVVSYIEWAGNYSWFTQIHDEHYPQSSAVSWKKTKGSKKYMETAFWAKVEIILSMGMSMPMLIENLNFQQMEKNSKKKSC